MATNLTNQVREISNVTKAVAAGDLAQKVTVEVKGEILELKNTVNSMVDQLSTFASEVTRVALEVGTQGKLGGQARVIGVAGTWKVRICVGFHHHAHLNSSLGSHRPRQRHGQ